MPLDLDSTVPPDNEPDKILRIIRNANASDDDIAEARRIFDDMKAHGLRDGGPVPLKNLTYRQLNAMLLDGMIYVNKKGTKFIACFNTEPPATLLEWPPVVDPCVVYIDRGNVRVRLSDKDDGEPAYIGVVDGDAVHFPKMIGSVKTWPESSIESISDDSRGDIHAVLSIIDVDEDGVRKRKTRNAYYINTSMTLPTRKVWPHGLIIDDTGVVTVKVPYPEEDGTLARVGHVETLPPGESIVFDEPIRLNRTESVRQRLYMNEIVACTWDYEIHGLHIVDKAGRIHRYRATIVSGITPTMIARDPETLRVVDDLLETTRHGYPNNKGWISSADLMDRLGLDSRTAQAVLVELCFDDVLELVPDSDGHVPRSGMVIYYRRYDPSRLRCTKRCIMTIGTKKTRTDTGLEDTNWIVSNIRILQCSESL